MKLSKSTYFKKYIGKHNISLTGNYEKNGLNKNHKLISKYSDISAIVSKTGDIAYYLVNGAIHNTKTRYDKNKQSSQKHENVTDLTFSKDAYSSSYIGKINKSRTKAYKRDGLQKDRKLVRKYRDLYAIADKYNDIVGYLVNDKIHNTKTKRDMNTASHQPHEQTTDMKLDRSTYIKTYIGVVNKIRTQTYKKNGLSNDRQLVRKYRNLYAIVDKHNDIVGYLVNNKIHNTKTKRDSNRASQQSYEQITDMKMDKEKYIKTYIGKVDKIRTRTYKKSGLSKDRKLIKKYRNISAIVDKYNDIVGYLVDDKIHRSKSPQEMSGYSSQSWEKPEPELFGVF
tara:strand:+ start:303 stop:1319 length:1017 start_codon:yes stop_codon:yes gene_type:complete